jgi:hypothetical protein
MGNLSSLVETKRCPKCASTDVWRSPRRGFYELVLLSSISMRPFRCLGCANRFYRFSFNGRAASSSFSRVRDPHTRSQMFLPVLIYGYGIDKEPFQEKSNARLVSMHSAELTLMTKVQCGKRLALLDPASDEELQGEIASVTEQPDGSNVIGVQFSHSVLEFWSATKFSNGK